MVNNKAHLNCYLTEELKRFNCRKPSIKDWLLHNEVWYIYHYQHHLRLIQYIWSGPVEADT